MTAVAALLLALAFGGADQYLGSLSAHPWAAVLSLLSAPWLLLAFAAGSTQRDAKRAALLGFACTFAALVGYGLMTLSPLENAHVTLQSGTAVVRSGVGVIGGGVLTGPLFGWFGFQWRRRGRWFGALIAAAAFFLEPLAHEAAGNAIRFHSISVAEVAVGIAMVVYVAAATRRES